MSQLTLLVEKKRSNLFGYLLLLTIFFLLIEISLFIQTSDIYLGDISYIGSHLAIPKGVIPGILFFILVQLSLHLVFTIIIWSMARLISVAFHCTWKKTEKLGLVIWFIGILTILFLNQYFYPNSKFAILVGFIIPNVISKILLVIFTCLTSIILLISLFTLFKISSNKVRLLLLVMALIPVAILSANDFNKPITKDAATAQKPNIIIIGIDAIRPDFLGYFGYEKHSPHLDDFLNQSSVFVDAFTPDARTFPAWMSILTGFYPKNNGVRFVLPTLEKFNWQTTLSHMLQKDGYETIYASDETRFSNIDKRFGFDKIVTPPIGFNDFLLGNLNDFPMANLLVNTSIGKYLFPHSYGNRPVTVTYNPNSFIKLLEPALTSSRTKPLLLTIHFCLPHYPYFWGNKLANNKSIRNYRSAINRVDTQFNDFMSLLKRSNLLNHSIVVLLSDHGEAIELPGDRITEQDFFIPGKNNTKGTTPHFYPKSFDFETVNQSAGHGTDILSLSQYRILFAFRTYGLEKNQKKMIEGQVSLLDIKPTLLDFINYSYHYETDGASLKKYILNYPSPVLRESHFFIETDYSPQSIRTVHPETRNVLLEGINLYQIDLASALITIRKHMGEQIISSKQYADIYGEWILALYPQNLTKRTAILVNLTTGEWTNDFQTQFAQNSPAKLMLKELKNFYGNEISLIDNIHQS